MKGTPNVALALALLLVACGPVPEPPLPSDDTPVGSAPVPRSTTAARFDWEPGQVPSWGDVPFPNDLFADELGHPTLPAGFPNPRAEEPLFRRVAELLGTRRGFCTSCNISFFFDGDLDVTTVGPSLRLVDLTEGTEVPVEFEWHGAQGRLALRPARGHVLRPARRYAALVGPELRGADGLPVGVPRGLVASYDDAAQAARLRELAEVGVEPSDWIAFSTFRTDEPARDLEAMKLAAEREEAPRASVERVWAGAEIDDLLGPQSFGEPGVDRVAAGARGVRHDTTAFVVAGTLRAPRFVEGAGSDVGVITRDAGGIPEVASFEDVPFVLMVPQGADLANLPVVVAHHGFSASRTTGFVYADTAGRAGWAVLAIDAYQHGDRAGSASDRENSMRGAEGPDGFAETHKLDVVSSVFGFAGVPLEMRLSPEYALSAFLQFSADALSAVRFVRAGDASEIAAADPALAALRFDPARVVYAGNSMGAVVGMGVTAVDDDLAGAVLNVLPGSIVETLVESGEFRPLTERVFLPLLGVTDKFDEGERSMIYDPTVDLFRWVLEPVDPLSLASTRATSKALVQLAGHDEVAAPRPSESVAAAAGFGLLTRYPGAMHGMLEVTVQQSQFEAPLIPPLVRRPEAAEVHNPIVDVHDEVTQFLTDIGAQ